MSTEKTQIGTAWTDITASLSLADGTIYTLQNRSAADLLVAESAAEPTDDQQSHIVKQNLFLYLIQAAIPFYAKSTGDANVIAVTETT